MFINCDEIYSSIIYNSEYSESLWGWRGVGACVAGGPAKKKKEDKIVGSR